MKKFVQNHKYVSVWCEKLNKPLVAKVIFSENALIKSDVWNIFKLKEKLYDSGFSYDNVFIHKNTGKHSNAWEKGCSFNEEKIRKLKEVGSFFTPWWKDRYLNIKEKIYLTTSVFTTNFYDMNGVEVKDVMCIPIFGGMYQRITEVDHTCVSPVHSYWIYNESLEFSVGKTTEGFIIFFNTFEEAIDMCKKREILIAMGKLNTVGGKVRFS